MVFLIKLFPFGASSDDFPIRDPKAFVSAKKTLNKCGIFRVLFFGILNPKFKLEFFFLSFLGKEERCLTTHGGGFISVDT